MTAERLGVELVPMTAAHVEELMPFEQDMFGTEAWTRSAYLAELADVELRYYIAAREQEALLGWAGVLIIGDTAQIVTVGVLPAARRRGIARQMVTALMAEARRRGAREVLLEVRVDNDAAQRLYASEGFTELRVRRGYYDNGRVDAVEMRREL